MKLIRGLGDDADNGSYVMEIDAHNTKPFRVVVHVDSIDSFKGRVFTEFWWLTELSELIEKLTLEALATPIEHGDNASALSLADKFIEEATRLIELNPNSPPHENDEPGQMCFACDEKEACVRLSSCDCQTMFCTDCMIRFFSIFFIFF